MKKKLLNGLENIVKGIGKSIKNSRKGLLTTAAVFALPFIFNSNAKASEGTLTIANNAGSPYTPSNCSIFHYPGGTEGYDQYDSIYYPMYNPSNIASFIVSSAGGYDLDGDTRPVDSTSSASLSLGLISKSGDPITISSDNTLYVSCSGFEDEDVWVETSVGTFNAKTTSSIDLPRLEGTFSSGSSYDSVSISFSPIYQPPEITYPEVETLPVIEFTDASATFTGTATFDGSEEEDISCSYRFSYRPSGGSFTSTPWECCVDEGDTFSATVTGLQPDMVYFVKAEISNSEYENQGGLERFLTLSYVDPNEPVEPNEPDPNAPPIPFSQEKNSAIFQYFILNQDPNNFEHGTWTYAETPDGSTKLNEYDIFATPQPGDGSTINSLKTISTDNPTEFVALSKHVNPETNDPNHPDALNEMTITGNQDTYHHTLKVWINNSENSFNGKTLVFQQLPLDENDTNTYPVYSIPAAIEHNNRTIDLGSVLSHYKSNKNCWL